ncbi:MFS transporter [Bradyrhizobium symbiodeficiens]|uniref:MFS transporter n=1 Tax=Bradyrhizobium symbiodeficiens TaxID=1404367 RepID=UPI000BA1A291|nr:MFS transporter [Bradyrhizobium symbiodeficiens]AWM05572.1 MFS transporter [Bradyrhizobium symbiodeficiens]QIO98539.1 MFS transporter [Bradyrhizobium symbiodeficiens]
MSHLDEQALIRRLAWRLMPLLILLFLVAFIDRQNVSFAKLQMVSDLHLSEASYGFGSSLFFIGYVAFEVPSCLALERYGARLWLALLILSWGVVTVLMAFTSSASSFYALRFLLGAAEAGFYPGAVFYISTWFPEPHRIRMLGLFTLGSSLGNMLGGLTNGLLLDLNGTGGLAGWQWVFVGTGIPAVLLTFAVLIYLPSSPESARFLDESERQILAAAHARRQSRISAYNNPWAALWDPTVIAFGSVYMLYATAFYGVTYWLPTIVKAFGVSPTVNGLLNMIPWALGAAIVLAVPRLLRDDRSIFSAAMCATLLGASCFVASILLPDNTLRFIALAIGGPCLVLLNPCFWTFPPRFFSGARAAASIAAINSIGNLGGFFAQNLAPWVERQTGSVLGPMLVPSLCLGLLCIGSTLLWIRTLRQTA